MRHSTQCRLCGGQAAHAMDGVLLENDVSYFDCESCGYVQTEMPSWLEKAYANPINDSDTGILVRNQRNRNVVLATLILLRKLDNKVVDAAGGYGILVRLLRDVGVDAYWSDLYTPNLMARGFEYENGQAASLVTAFEAFEHFVEPTFEFDRLLEVAPNILISTEVIPDKLPAVEDWWYYGTDHGQHIGFFRKRTLRYLAKSRNMRLLSDGKSYHLFTRKCYNETLWLVAMRIKSLLKFYAGFKLTSKTWTDHEMHERS